MARRLAQHEGGRGAKNLRGKSPLQVVFQVAVGERSLASRLEARVKKLSRADKESLLRGEIRLDDLV